MNTQKPTKINSEIAAHNVATILTQSSIEDSNLQNLQNYTSGEIVDFDGMLEYSKKFYKIYKKIYKDAYQYYNSERD